jgi:hypothetical protein
MLQVVVHEKTARSQVVLNERYGDLTVFSHFYGFTAPAPQFE